LPNTVSINNNDPINLIQMSDRVDELATTISENEYKSVDSRSISEEGGEYHFFFISITAPVGLGLPPWNSPFHFGFFFWIIDSR
jgi:hypothetical protein